MTAVMARSACDCGTMKKEVAGFMFCEHCDTGCSDKTCPRCRNYDLAVSRRLTR